MGKVSDMMKYVASISSSTGASTLGGFDPYIPQTLEADYDAFLAALLPYANYTFAVKHDWYGASTFNIRGLIYTVNWKSKYSGSDTASNFRTSLSSNVRKGDIITRGDGAVYMIVWEVEPDVNNKKSQVQLCNLNVTFQRAQKAVLDADHKVVTPAGFTNIASSLPCIGYEMANQYEYGLAQNTPGVIPNNQAIIYVQFNSTTDAIKIDDEFNWHKHRYKVVDIAVAEIDVTGTFGILTFTCEKVPGGGL